ncbi:proteasome 26S non-ATPase subunit 9, putative [Trypanosoma cruzi]|uniref:Proteasome 26S non-ATPase subunit 9 n=2 Tax=Trypanosoma cruzi TaxID=5693 RepID=V5AKS5_TRYCR|nr:proteasome 26S non-ATPase subunit 9, putative [Trypanosoma cruzi]ESS61275.1 proteasome 26S non-ATPase subunit 9 [Trypanosoma cruzi Dm28c]PBJ78249.1 proteasome 26S non-ATPase subunit 9 [Trypanosoma cruzi cruzi]PWU92789.1 putative proteasome 26S non-ATPase subunit 9 [Trypanosoma cruzi]
MMNGLTSSLREELLRLDEQRTAVMRQIEEAMAFLNTTPVGLNGPLVDGEGFPRNDCDLYAVRRARQAVICGRNDLTALENSMHEKLALLHEENQEEATKQMERDNEARRKGKSDALQREQRMRLVREMSKKSPFVRVLTTSANSPGAQAGLTAGDLIVQYGEIDAVTVAAKGFGEMARATASHEGKMISVWVKRKGAAEDEAVEILLVPTRWAGSGLIGCEFEPCLQG